jgi:putative transposase
VTNNYSPDHPTRKLHRLQSYDYSTPGFYFVTICTRHRNTWFGHIADGDIHLSNAGSVAQEVWTALPDRFLGLALDQFVIMPNHLHGLLVLGEEAMDKCCQRKIMVADIIRAFKGAVTYRIRREAGYGFAWQRGFYDSVVRDAVMLDKLRLYIINNPVRWTEDQLYRQAVAELAER